MASPRLTKASQEVVDTFGFVFGDPPERDLTRRSKYDPMWEAVKTLLLAHPNQSVKVRTYTNASAAYQEAKAINNGEHRHFKDEGSKWTAVGTKSDDENDVDEEGNVLYAIWLEYTPE